MSPTQQMYNWTNSNSNQDSQFNSQTNSTGGQTSFGFNSNSTNNNSFLANSQNNNNNTLPKFGEAFDSKCSWSNSSSRRGSSENIFGNSQRRVDWDGEVDQVFTEEIVKFANDFNSQNRQK